MEPVHSWEKMWSPADRSTVFLCTVCGDWMGDPDTDEPLSRAPQFPICNPAYSSALWTKMRLQLVPFCSDKQVFLVKRLY